MAKTKGLRKINLGGAFYDNKLAVPILILTL